MNKFIFVVISFFLFPSSIYASGINNSHNESSISITVEEPILEILSVQPVEFPPYNVSSISNTIESQSDLIIRIRHNQDDHNINWTLRYGVSSFYSIETFDSYLGPNTELIIGEGTFNNIDKSQYYSSNSVITSEDSAQLVKAKTLNSGVYEYTIPKESIHLKIDESSKLGNYEFEQTITMFLVPDI